MPRPAAAIGADGLPLWDTFEALFFLVAGLSVGIVLGILFPSLWRTFRRRFRDPNRFAPHESRLPTQIQTPLVILESDPDASTDPLSGGVARYIPEAFVLARGAFQEGKPRDAVKIYLDILGNEQVSKEQTNRAMFELAQVYQEIGLQSRAVDTASELLYRKPDNTTVFSFLLDVCVKNLTFDKLKNILEVYRGPVNDPLRMRISHALCSYGERLFQNSKETLALAEVRSALRWQVLSGRAKILLWRITSEDLWKKSGQNTRSLWSALAADLEARFQIQRETQISPAAGAEHLSKLLAFMSAAHAPRSIFLTMQREFLRISGLEKMNAEQIEKFERIIFYAFMELVRDRRFLRDASLFEVLECLTSGPLLSLARNLRESAELEHLRTEVLNTAVSAHRCTACGSFHAHFDWFCRVCGALESFVPILAAETPPSLKPLLKADSIQNSV